MGDDSASSLDRAFDEAARREPDLDEQRAFGAFQSRLFGQGGERLRIGGRYELGPLLGAGGVGAVYRARDPQLDRDVAVKVLQPGDSAIGEIQLLREAQTIAKLSHPNVVEIYDVGLHGAQGEVPRVFFVMELVRGRDLHQALSQRPWSSPEILEVFRAAGRGLAAAHREGLVHRDFKPHNVLLGEGGAVKVADFGAGVVAGTPRYMSPEQRRNETLDPRSDQYSFCVALYEALEGEAPRQSPSDALREPREPSTRRIWRVLRQGLEVELDARFPSMEALLAALSRRRRRSWWLGIGVAGAAAAGLVAWLVPDAGCPTPDEARDELWPATQRDAVERSVRAAVPGRADEVWSMMGSSLDAYAESWASLRSDACKASSNDDAGGGWTKTCLGRRGQAFSALVEVLGESDAAVADRALRAVRGLPSLDSCLDAEASEALVLPVDPRLRERVASLEGQLARVKALEIAGRFEDAVSMAQSVLEAAEEAGHDPTTAFAAYRLGAVLTHLGRIDDATELLRRAAFAGLECGHDLVVAGAAIKLINSYAERGDLDELEVWRRHAMTAIERGDLPADIEARVHLELGASFYARSAFERALEESSEAARLYAESLGEDDPEYATALNNMAGAAFSMGDQERALELMERSIDIRRRVLGPSHPALAGSLSNLGAIAIQLDRHEDAQRFLAQAREGLEADETPNHVRYSTLLLAEGALARKQGRLGAAVTKIRAAIESAKAAGGASGDAHAQRARMQLVLAYIDGRREQEAIEAAQALVPECAELGVCAESHTLRAIALAEFGRDDEARAARDLADQQPEPIDDDLRSELDELLSD